MQRIEIENIEIELLLEAIFKQYGYDFRCYTKTSIERRIRQFLTESGYKTVSEMIPKLLYDQSFFEQIIRKFSITVTEMFRDPLVYHSIRKKVVPLLKTYPFLKTWDAGCATGEETYSLSILLKEENLYDRTRLFGTDFNDEALEKAKEGIYALDNIKEFTSNYQQAGGTRSFSEYYYAHYGNIVINQSLKQNTTFANHNLVTDGVFSEIHLILCRNVLIYFNKELQHRVLNLFCDSLIHGGFLCLGSNESLQFSGCQDHFKAIDEKCRIYQKKV